MSRKQEALTFISKSSSRVNELREFVSVLQKNKKVKLAVAKNNSNEHSGYADGM